MVFGLIFILILYIMGSGLIFHPYAIHSNFLPYIHPHATNIVFKVIFILILYTMVFGVDFILIRCKLVEKSQCMVLRRKISQKTIVFI